MSKRPLQNNYSNLNSKKSKQDFDSFKAPNSSRNHVNAPQIHYNPKPNPPTTTKVSLLQHSIVDKEKQIYLDDEDDDVLMMASQSAEEQDRLNRNNESYSGFIVQHAHTSTQHALALAGNNTGYTEKIKKDHCIVLNTENVGVATQNSQKENFSSSYLYISKQQDQIKELNLKLNENSVKLKETMEKNLMKDGEAKNLRLSIKTLENQVKKMKLEKLEAANTSKIDPEKEALRREVEALKAQKEFNQINTFPRLNSSVSEPKAAKVLSSVQFHTNTSAIPSVLPQMSTTMFEPEETRPTAFEPRKAAIDREMTNYVVKIQLKLAETYARIVSGHNFSDEAVEDIFSDCADMIFRIGDFIEYLETDETSPFAIDNNPALTAAVMLSLTIRPKMTKIDLVRDALMKNGGRWSIFQAKKMFPEEICSKPRRIIAFYAVLAKHSQKFSEKLLTDNISKENNHRTFVSVLVDILLTHVSQSDDFYDYCGLVIAVGGLLSSLGAHYGKYTNNSIIDIALEQLLHAVLMCRCDNPLLMVEVAKFMADISSHAEKTGVISKLCVNFPMSEIREISRSFRHFEFPSDACLLHLFFSYLLTTFKYNLNVFEMELLMETLLNLNRLTSNIMELPISTVKFMSQSLVALSASSCGCLQQLTNATVSLNYLVMAHRNMRFTQLVPLGETESSAFPRLIDSMEFPENHNFFKELAKRGVTLTRDLFSILEPFTDYPLNNLVFSNRLEQFWNFLKREKVFDINGNLAACRTAYRLNGAELEALAAISLQPNLMATDESDNDNFFSDEDEDKEGHLVEMSCAKSIDLDKMPNFS